MDSPMSPMQKYAKIQTFDDKCYFPISLFFETVMGYAMKLASRIISQRAEFPAP